MIVTEFYHGQGLGNQLWSYVAARSLALRMKTTFGFIGIKKFKGHDFLSLDFGQAVKGGCSPEGGPPFWLPRGITNYFVEKEVWYERFSCDIRGLDKRLLNLPDNVKIEGYFQSEDLILPYREQIREWLKPIDSQNNRDYAHQDICVINIRGGEYKGSNELLLERTYWLNAKQHMLNINYAMKFVIVTDDTPYARTIFPDLEVVPNNIASDFSIIMNAHYLILSNSSFAFFPAWINTNLKVAIAPKYWARHNVSDGFWACEFNIYNSWQYLDRDGTLFSADECRAEYEIYKTRYNINNITSRPIRSPLGALYLQEKIRFVNYKKSLKTFIKKTLLGK